MEKNTERYMRRCLELAGRGMPAAFPNPLVGAVVVHNDLIIGEGYHRQYGQAHAEVNAIEAVKDKGLLKDSSIYVSLEPCSFHGKTPPCSELIIKHRIKKCVIASMDPNPKVSGKGINMLRSAGVEVLNGVLEEEAVKLNKRFFTYQKKKRPYVVLKWAQTRDGYIADKEFGSKWISNKYSRILVHKWRTEEAAIYTGKNTILKDNPALTARDWPGKSPLRIIVDRKLELDRSLRIFNDDAACIIFNEEKEGQNGKQTYARVDFSRELIPQIMDHLYDKKIQSVMVEGGAGLLNDFLRTGIWDEARVFIGEREFGEGLAATVLPMAESEELALDGDLLKIFINPQNIIYEV